MKEIGEQLREERIAKGISLESISARTKISRKYLQAMEEGEFEKLPPGDPYIKGFIRSYARAINYDPTDVIEMYVGKKAEEEPIELPDYKRSGGFLRRVNQTLQWFGL